MHYLRSKVPCAMDKFMQWMHRYVQPVFLAMFVAAFIFWYIAKLS